MKFAIIADIHANLQALQAVLVDMKQQKCTDAACLGDIVGYNAHPKECLDIIRGMNIPCVKRREQLQRRVCREIRDEGAHHFQLWQPT